MNMPFQVKVPIDLASELNARLKEIKELHAQEVEALQRTLRTLTDPTKALAEQRRVGEQGRRVTIQHVLRVTLLHGIERVRKMSGGSLLAAVNSDTICVGRPSEAKRGSRTA